MRVIPFAPEFETEVVELIVSIQRDEFEIDISADDQPDLRGIASYYQTGRGNFWVAVLEGRVVGTISLLDIGAKQAALRKMFVAHASRGPALGVAKRLLETLVGWGVEQEIREIFLGTTPFFHAAHRFYEKHGFSEIPRSRLPASFPIMEVDKKFYHLVVPKHIAGN